MEYDTAKEYIEHCADSNTNGLRAEAGFLLMHQAAGELGNYNPLRANFYAWLKSVLYLNTTDPEYFCQCVEAIAGELPVPNHIYPDTGINWGLAVINWLLQNTKCDSLSLARYFHNGRQEQYNDWSNASGAYALDTTLPSIKTIDPQLDSLLNLHLLNADVPENYVGILSNATANPNPVSAGTVISFSIAKEAYVKIELFNVLGHEVSSAGFESLFEPGNKSVPLSLMGLPSGTYFARILTAYGEVQSVKLVKE